MEQEELRETIYSVYARTNEDGLVTHIFSDCFEQPRATDIFLKSGYGDEFVHVGGGNPCTIEGIPRYKIEHGEMIERSAEELERERSNCLQKQLELEKERNYQMVTDVLTETVSNNNLVINPDFHINQRDGYVVKEGATVYFDTEFTQVANTSVPAGYKVEEIHKDYAILKTKKAPVEGILYAKIEDIEKGYVMESSSWAEKQYTFDRWFLRGYGTLMEKEDGILFKKLSEENQGFALLGTILDDVKDLEGKALTLTLCLNDTMISNTLEEGWSFTEGEQTILYVRGFKNFDGIVSLIANASRQLEIRIYLANGLPVDTSCKIKWVKLELGELATKFEAPEREIELIKCKRYYREITTNQNLEVCRSDVLISNIRIEGMKGTPIVRFKNSKFNTADSVYIINGDIKEGFYFTLSMDAKTKVVSIRADKQGHGLDYLNTLLVVTEGNPICFSTEKK